MGVNINEGESTPVHGIDVPEEYENFINEYLELVEKVDTGITIVEETKADLDQYEGGSHSNVLALVLDEGKFYQSSGGEFNDSVHLDIDYDELDDEDIDDLAEQLEDEFLPRDGGRMDGPINMDGNDVTNANEVEVNNITGTAGDEIDTLEQDLGELEVQVDTLQDDLNEAENDIATLDSRVTDAENDISDLEASVSNLDSRLTSAESDISSLQNRMDDAETDINSLETEVSDLWAEINNIDSDISSIEDDISALETRVSTNENNIDNLESDKVDRSGDRMQGDLDMNGNNVDNAGTVDAEQLQGETVILPIR